MSKAFAGVAVVGSLVVAWTFVAAGQALPTTHPHLLIIERST